MQIVLDTEARADYVRYRPVTCLDAKTREKAENIFEDYRSCGVITGSYSDDAWQATNEIARTTYDFRFNELMFRNCCEPWVGCTAACYGKCLRAYVVFLMGKYTLPFIREVLKELKALAEMDAEEALCRPDDEMKPHAAGFLSILPESNDIRDYVMEMLEEEPRKKKKKEHRELADFRYFLRFDKSLQEYWEYADDRKKEFYFPVYFWWKLTCVLPLRATEFLVTPRTCVSMKEGRYTITIRRTRLKKGIRRIAYRLDEDYEPKTYEIPEELYRQIRWYQEVTKDKVLPAIGTLLVPDRETPSGYFTYTQMRRRLMKFCGEVFGDEAYPVHPGDTRHLAMINLMLSGGSPVICRELAGHEDLDISSNYYANMSAVVESSVLEMYHGGYSGTSMEGSFLIPAADPAGGARMGKGWCMYPGIEDGDMTGCLDSYSIDGTLGNCRDCRYYRPDEPGIRMDLEIKAKQKVDADAAYLFRMIEQVRKSLGYTETIQEAMLRLQASAGRYRALLAGHYEEEV